MAEPILSKTEVRSNWSRADHYNLIIIGSGIAGLTTGLLWQKNHPSDRILIIEKEPYPGGYVTAYKREGYVFETTQLFPDVIQILEYIGVELNLKQYTGNFMRRIVVHDDGVKEYHLPAGAENLKRYLQDQFPSDAKKIAALMDYSVEMFAQVRKLKAISTLKDKLIIPFAAPKVVANLNRTYEELLDKFEITNPELRELMETFTSFAGVPPGRASSILTAGGMLSSISRCFRPYGYFDEFPSSMAKLFQERGGEIRLSAKVDSLPVENNRAVSLRVEGDDRSIRADRFVSTLDPNILVHDIVGDEAFPPAYVKKLKDTVMSSSSLNIALGLDDGIDMTGMDLDYPYNVVSTGLGTTDALFDAFLEGRNGFTSDRFHMAVICPSLTTGERQP